VVETGGVARCRRSPPRPARRGRVAPRSARCRATARLGTALGCCL